MYIGMCSYIGTVFNNAALSSTCIKSNVPCSILNTNPWRWILSVSAALIGEGEEVYSRPHDRVYTAL